MRPWDSLSEDEKTLFRRMAEVYAGFLSHTDHEIGRLLDYLEQAGELDNTIIVFCSDNGASGEGGPDGSVNENKFFNGIPDSLEENLKYLDELGSPETYNHYPTGWAAAFNTPMKMWKRFNFEGGTADPLIVSWPAGIEAKGELRHQYCHATDIVPMVYDCLGIELPEAVKGYPQVPLEGVSLRSTFEDADAPTPKDTAFFSMLGSRAIWHKGWKAVAVHPSAPSDWSHFGEDRWELYDTEATAPRCTTWPTEHPEKLRELVDLWYHEAGRYNGLPLDDRTALEILGEERPQLTVPRERYVYRAGLSEVPEASAVNIRNRSFTIAAEVEIADENAGGVVFAHGSRFGGHALYLKDGTLKYVNNFCGITEQIVEASGPRAAGQGDPLGGLREGGRHRADDRHAVALRQRREGRRGDASGPNPGSSRSRARASTSAATAPTPSPRTTRAPARGRSPAARSTRSWSTSPASRSSTSRRRRPARSCATEPSAA